MATPAELEEPATPDPDRKRTKVAVAVVSWNTRELLSRCLDSMRASADAGLVDVWVIDNASADGSGRMVEENYPWVNLRALKENIGFGRAVNIVANETRTPWIAAANADIALRPGCLERLLEAGERDPGAGAIAPRLILADGSPQHSVFAFPTIPFSLAYATGAYRLSRKLADRMALPGRWDTERARRVPWAVAAFLMIRRAAWDQVGGFDERQWMYAEDLDIGWRLHDAGWATRYEPSASADHEGSASTTQQFGTDLPPHWQRSTYGCLVRRRGLVRTWSVALCNTLAAVLRALAALPELVRNPRRGRMLVWAHLRWALVHLRALRGRKSLERLT
jgi:N-acetylglucosaminyl-diphospho-decaprenol L-rhamnosyltransferase